MISRYALDAYAYQYGNGKWDTLYPGWRKGNIRKWLNSTFLNKAFTAKEQQSILTTTVKTGNNAEWVAFAKKRGFMTIIEYMNGGVDTQDKVFLLSLEEAMAYAGYNTLEDFYDQGVDKLKTIPTPYAIAQGAKQSDTDKLNGIGCCWWWLRSPAEDSYTASIIASDGSLRCNFVCNKFCSVRPVLWINLDSAVID